MVRPEEVFIQNAEEGADYSADGAGNQIAGVIELRTFLAPFTASMCVSTRVRH